MRTSFVIESRFPSHVDVSLGVLVEFPKDALLTPLDIPRTDDLKERPVLEPLRVLLDPVHVENSPFEVEESPAEVPGIRRPMPQGVPRPGGFPFGTGACVGKRS
eukprot:14361543-Heterocapsa_arctica.AAC.1